MDAKKEEIYIANTLWNSGTVHAVQHIAQDVTQTQEALEGRRQQEKKENGQKK